MAGRKNNHYHYAEKFDDKRRRKSVLFIPRRATFVAALVLLMFGLISTTFAAYVSSDDTDTDSGNSIIVDIRTAKAERDIAVTGADVDLAASGYDVTSGAIVYFDTTGWDTSSYSHVQIMIGHGTYSSCYDMTNVSGNLYYVTMPSWGGFTQLCFIANTSSWGSEGNSPDSRKTYAHYYTNTWGSSNLTATKYVFRSDLSSNNNNLSSISDGNYNTLLNSTFNLTVATKKGANGSYNTDDNAGGSATMSGTTKTTNSATSTTTFSTNADGTNYPMIGTSVTLSQSTTAGYTFVKYVFDSAGESSTQAGSPIPMTSWKNETTNVFALYKENMHSVNLTNDVDSTSTSYSNCIGVATTSQFTAPTKSGYTFSSWTVPTGMTITSGSTTSSTITVKSTASAAATLTLRANYTINPPTNVSITGNSMKVGDTAVSLDPHYTVPSGITGNVSYSIVDENNNDASSVASVDSSGNFTASIPGVYTVTISVTATDGTQTSSAVTDTATVIVSPAVPSWTLTMSGYDEGTGTQADPFVVTLGSNFSFTAAITNPPSDSNYVYTWYNGNNEVLGTGRTLTFGAATASEATTASVQVEVYCIVSYTGTSPTTTSDSIDKWYIIKSLIKSFEIPDMQKIYATPNDAKMDIEYNITSATDYDTSLYFSSDNLTFYQVDVAHGAFLGAQVGNTAVYRYDPSAQMYPVGVKYFYLAMSKTGASAKTDVIHTTVGTDDDTATRAVYFINNIGSLNLSTYRVMAFYIDGNGDLKYQTAQDVFKGVSGHTENQRFRVMIPSNATKISFAVAKRNRYDIPADGTNSPVYSSDFFYAYTDYVTLTADANTVKANTMSNQVSDPTADPLYLMTTQYLTYQTAG